MWISDLDNFLEILDKLEEQEEKERLNEPGMKATSGGKRKKIPKRKRKKDDDDDFLEKAKPNKKKQNPKVKEEKGSTSVKIPKEKVKKIGFEDRLMAKFKDQNEEKKKEIYNEMMDTFQNKANASYSSGKRPMPTKIDELVSKKPLLSRRPKKNLENLFEESSEEEFKFSKKAKKLMIDSDEDEYIPLE